MTNYNERLDEILFEAIEAAATYTHNVTAEEADYIQNKSKQAIQDLIRTEKLQAKTSEVRLMRSEAREAWDNGTVTSDFYERIKVYTDSRLDELKLEAEL